MKLKAWRYTGKLVCEAPRHARGGLYVACRKCEECTEAKVAAVGSRGALEEGQHGPSAFFSLTYNDAHLPKAIDPETGEILPTVRRRDLRLFRMRARNGLRALGASYRLLACSEYGPLHGRPHYHGELYGADGDDPRVRQVLRQAWTDGRTKASRGFIDCERVLHGCASYVTKYVCKRMRAGDPALRGREPDTVSWPRPALGAAFADALGATVRESAFRRQLVTEALGDVPGRVLMGGRARFVPSVVKRRARQVAGLDGPADKALRAEVLRWQIAAARSEFDGDWSHAGAHVDATGIAKARKRRELKRA